MTSVRISTELLKRADKRAQALGISRNRLIVRALERELEEASDWSVGFFDRLRSIDPDTVEAVDEMMFEVGRHRRSKRSRR